MDLKQHSTGELKKELERRSEMERPEAIENPDLKELHEVCQSFINFIDSKEYHEDNDYEDYISEQALITLYGKDVFDWINKNI